MHLSGTSIALRTTAAQCFTEFAFFSFDVESGIRNEANMVRVKSETKNIKYELYEISLHIQHHNDNWGRWHNRWGKLIILYGSFFLNTFPSQQ